MRLLAAAFAASLLAMSYCAAGQTVSHDSKTAVPPAPVSVKAVLYARPFTLGMPYRNGWSKERAMVSAGVLVVLDVDPALVVPRETLEPVLYAGNVAVQRLNHGNESGHVIAIIPATVDLASTPIWFGSPRLPERVTEAVVRSERERAEKAGVRSFPAKRIAGVQHPAVAAADLGALLRDVAAQLVDQYSPQEKQLADSWRLPTATAPNRKK